MTSSQITHIDATGVGLRFSGGAITVALSLTPDEAGRLANDLIAATGICETERQNRDEPPPKLIEGDWVFVDDPRYRGEGFVRRNPEWQGACMANFGLGWLVAVELTNGTRRCFEANSLLTRNPASGSESTADGSRRERREREPVVLGAKSKREREMVELLRSAHCIAERKGENTAWERFAASIKALGIGSVTSRPYRVLSTDPDPANSSQPMADGSAPPEGGAA